MTFKTVFDVGSEGYSTWWFAAPGVLLVCIGVASVFKPMLMSMVSPADSVWGRPRTIFSWFFLTFALVWTLGSFAATYRDYQAALSALSNRKYRVVEGSVADFVPMPVAGRAKERFVVRGVRFSYSDSIVTPGFHRTASHGGPIRQGLHVRVTYFGNLILRLEVAK
jgi:hypothetical protein